MLLQKSISLSERSVSSNADHSKSYVRPFISLLAPLAAFSLSACVAPPPRERVVEPPPAVAPTEVYVYPSNGQSDAQLDRDRYECNDWAVKQSHYDPSQVHDDAQRVRVVVGPPPGVNTAAGAVTGAVIGSVIAGPRDGAGGALFGALAGAMIGAASDNANQQQAERVQQRYDRQSTYSMQQAQAYRRAISACLEGRGYTVK